MGTQLIPHEFLFQELQRRKVYRVAVGYVAGGIIQLASAVFPAWDLPDWALRVVVVQVLDELLSRPSDVTVAILKLDPIMDGLRSDPAFQRMLAQH